VYAIYFVRLSVWQTASRWMVGRLVNDWLEGICDEAISTIPRSMLGINREELRKTTEILSQSPVKSGTRHHPDANQKLHCWRVSGVFFLNLFVVSVCQPAARWKEHSHVSVFVSTYIKLEELRWVEHVEVMVKMKHGYVLLLDESEGRRPLGIQRGG
jgi:hypothetical protein